MWKSNFDIQISIATLKNKKRPSTFSKPTPELSPNPTNVSLVGISDYMQCGSTFFNMLATLVFPEQVAPLSPMVSIVTSEITNLPQNINSQSVMRQESVDITQTGPVQRVLSITQGTTVYKMYTWSKP